jgi:hypothetical protein
LPAADLPLLLRSLPSLFNNQFNLSSNKTLLLPHPNPLTPQMPPTLLLAPRNQKYPRHNSNSTLRLLLCPPRLQLSSLPLNSLTSSINEPSDSLHHPHQLLSLTM